MRDNCTCHEEALDVALRFLQGRTFPDLIGALMGLNYKVEKLATPDGPNGHIFASGANHLCRHQHTVFFAIKRFGEKTVTKCGQLQNSKPTTGKRKKRRRMKAA